MAPRPEVEASTEEVRVRVVDVRLRLGLTGGRPAESYGPTSFLSEDLLLRGYGLRAQRVEEER